MANEQVPSLAESKEQVSKIVSALVADVSVLGGKASAAAKADDAMKFAQAALNVAHVVATLEMYR